MSDSYAKYKEDLADYKTLCKLLNETEREDWFDHFVILMIDDRVEYKNYHYQLKS